MKIKHVFIQAFRQFEKVHVNLTSTLDSNRASNFVVIYAPNGFGKTSFFDAMEFCVTKSIQRVSNNFKENFKVDQEQGDTTFIHNKDLTNLPIDIIMNFEEHGDIRTTCNFQDESAMLKSNGENLFFKNAILSQDWFSEFLSTRNAEQRFKIFTDYFVETKDLLDYYRRLSTASTSFNRVVIKMNKEVKSLKKEIDGNLNVGVIKQIEDGVKKLADVGISVQWDGKIDAESLAFLKMENEKKVAEIKTQKEDLANRISHFNLASVGNNEIFSIDTIECYEGILNEKQKQLKEYENWLKDLAVYLHTEKQIEEGRKSLCLYQKVSERLTYLIDNFDAFSKLYQNRIQLHKDKELLLKKNSNISILLDEKYKQRIQQENSLADYQKKRNLILSKIDNLNDRYLKLASLLKNKEDSENSLDTQNKLFLEATHNCDVLVKQSGVLVRLKISIEKGSFDSALSIYTDEVKLIQQLKEMIHSEEERLLLIEKGIKEKMYFEDELQRLIVSSHKVLEHLKGSKCPLCGTDFETQKKLLKNISENTVISAALEEEFQKKKTLEDKINQQKKSLSEKQNDLLGKIETDNSKVIEEIKSTNLSIAKLKDARVQLKMTLNNVQSKLVSEYADIEGIKQDDKLKELKSLVNALETNIASTQQTLSSLSTEIDQSLKYIKSNEVKIKEIDDKSITLSENDFYIEYRTKIGDKKFSQECMEDWKQGLASIGKEEEQITQQLNLSRHKLYELDKKNLRKEDAQAITEKRNVLSEEVSLKLTVWHNTLSFLMNVCMIPIESGAKSTEIKESFESVLKAVRKKQEEVDNKLLLLNQYDVLLTLGAKYSQNEERKVELHKKEKQLMEENKKKNLIDTEKTRLQKYLDDFVKGFFQLDIINKLYNTIDPHPEYKQIDFRCEFKNKDPRLNVIMKSVKEGQDTIVPNLYFSTAQINILSFCIFMAKALFAKTDKDEDLGCIFIDDPIQALDDINVLSMIDMLRNIAFSLNKQIILTTHDRNFFELLKKKVPSELFGSRFLEMKQRGVFSEG